jgi:hypothetical protein
MERHIKVARAHRALSWLYGLITAFLLVVVFAQGTQPGAGVAYGLLFFAGALFAVHYFTAREAWKMKSGARRASMIIAMPMLMAFPLGTVIGIYLLVNAWRPWDAGGPRSHPA